MELDELMAYVAGAFEADGVPYMLVGSMAAGLYGEPRLTADADFVVDLRPDQVAGLARHFPATEYYFDEGQIAEALRSHGQFNIIHGPSGYKADVVILDPVGHQAAEFARRTCCPLSSGLQLSVARAEDLILSKLQYYRMGGSEKHLRDCAGILRLSAVVMDLDYLSEWAGRLGVEDIWEIVRQRAEEP